MPKARVVTFGCRLNHFESEAIEALLKDSAFDDMIVLNTCAVTQEAERQARQKIRRLRRDNPKAFIVVTGCGAQLDPEGYGRMGEVNLVLGNHEKMKKESFLNEAGSFTLGLDNTVPPPLPDFLQKRTRAFVQIQNGCDHACTFCVITHARGASVSVDPEALCAEVAKMVSSGVREIVLTGVNITSYGSDLAGKMSLAVLVHRLFERVPDLARLRLSSVDPAEMGEDMLEVIAHEPRLLPHVHLSLQAGADLILKRMKRRHLREDVIELCEAIRGHRPDVTFGADVIVGFPTESDDHFEDTLDLVQQCNISMLHVFPYSVRPGTPAARMPQVPSHVIAERGRRLRRLGEKLLFDVMTGFVGLSQVVLLERPDFGHDAHHLPVDVRGGQDSGGSLVRVHVTSVYRGPQGLRLVGDVESVCRAS